MGYPPQYPQYPQYPPQPSRDADRVVSIILLVLAALTVAGGAFLGLLLLAFLDYCPPESCSANGALISVTAAVGLAVAVGIAGLVLTSVRLGRRQTAWPLALGTLVLCPLILGIGLIAFQTAVGWS